MSSSPDSGGRAAVDTDDVVAGGAVRERACVGLLLCIAPTVANNAATAIIRVHDRFLVGIRNPQSHCCGIIPARENFLLFDTPPIFESRKTKSENMRVK